MHRIVLSPILAEPNNNNMKTPIAFAIKTFYLSFIVTGFILALVNSL